MKIEREPIVYPFWAWVLLVATIVAMMVAVFNLIGDSITQLPLVPSPSPTVEVTQ